MLLLRGCGCQFREQGVRAFATTASCPTHPQALIAPCDAQHSCVAGPKDHRQLAGRTVRPRDLEVAARGQVLVDGEGAGPYDGHRWQHRLGPFLRPATNCGGRGLSRTGTRHPHHPLSSQAKSTRNERSRNRPPMLGSHAANIAHEVSFETGNGSPAVAMTAFVPPQSIRQQTSGEPGNEAATRSS